MKQSIKQPDAPTRAFGSRKKQIRNDMILIVVLLVFSGIMAIAINHGKKTGAQAVVKVEGETVASFPLSVDTSYRIVTAEGENWLVIEQGVAKVTDADCKDRLCVHQKAIEKTGETIVCLPHKVVVEITGGEEGELDGVAN
jgi:hypothetical protein